MFTAETICLIAGPIIAGLVQLFKAVDLVDRYPKVVAFLLSMLTAFVSGFHFGSLDWKVIATCVIGPFAAAVATYEVGKTVKYSIETRST